MKSLVISRVSVSMKRKYFEFADGQTFSNRQPTSLYVVIHTADQYYFIFLLELLFTQLPPQQQLGIELRTLSNSVDMKWEFKIAFSTRTMTPPASYPSNQHVNLPTPTPYSLDPELKLINYYLL